MTITFLIGNGFDKQLGLPTGYDSFLEWYVAQPSEDDDIAEFKEYLKSQNATSWWSDAEIAMGEYLKEFETDELDKYYKNIRDFKIGLLEYLLIIESFCDYNDNVSIASTFSDFLLNFHSEILLNKTGNLFDINKAITYNFINFNYTRTLTHIIDCFKLNYRYVFEGGSKGRIGDVHNVHGTLDSQIVMGVNDFSQLKINKDKIDRKLKRTLIKPQICDSLGSPQYSAAQELLASSDVIVIYGLSLGDTDKIWRDIIAKGLDWGDAKIVLFGHKKLDSINTAIPEDTIDYVEAKQDAFLKKLFTDITEEKLDQLRDRVFIVDKTSYLDFSIVQSVVATVV